MSVCHRKLGQLPPHFQRRRPKSPRRIYNATDREPIELTRGTHGVRSHPVEAQPIADAQRAWQLGRRAHAVDRVARRAPHAAVRDGLRASDMERAAHRQYVWVDSLMVEENTVERAVYPIVDVICRRQIRMNELATVGRKNSRTHDGWPVGLGLRVLVYGARVGRGRSPRNNISRETKRLGDIESSRLGNDLDTASIGEISGDRIRQECRRLLEQRVLEPAADIKKRELIARLGSHVECRFSPHHGVRVDGGVVTPAADMEAHSHDVEV